MVPVQAGVANAPVGRRVRILVIGSRVLDVAPCAASHVHQYEIRGLLLQIDACTGCRERREAITGQRGRVRQRAQARVRRPAAVRADAHRQAVEVWCGGCLDFNTGQRIATVVVTRGEGLGLIERTKRPDTAVCLPEVADQHRALRLQGQGQKRGEGQEQRGRPAAPRTRRGVGAPASPGDGSGGLAGCRRKVGGAGLVSAGGVAREGRGEFRRSGRPASAQPRHGVPRRLVYSRLSALGSRLSALGSRLSALGSRLSALGSRPLGSRLSALGSRLSALGSRLSALGSRLSALGSRLSALGSLYSVEPSAPESPPGAGLNGSLRPALNPPTVSCVNVPEAVSSRPSAAASLRRVPRSVPELSAPEIVRVDAICRLPPCSSPAPLAGGRSSRGTARSREPSARITQSNGAATCQRPLEHWSYDGGAY